MVNTAKPQNISERTADLCVIVPCRNEATILPQLFQQLASQDNIVLQVILADGESSDRSVEIAESAGACINRSPPGRGIQMNAAARLSQTPWLLFLHADSGFTHPQQLHRALTLMRHQHSQRLSAGHFPLSFVDRPTKQKRWQVLEYKTTTNRPLTISGDQGLMIHREHFERLGRFNESMPFLEDQIIAAHIHQKGQWQLLEGSLTTSARRFQVQGFGNRYGLMTLIMLAHYCGITDFLNPQTQYPEQKQATAIHLADHVKRFHRCILQQSPSNILRCYWRIASMTRTNGYQATLWADAAMGWHNWPLTKIWQSSVEKAARLPIVKQLLQFILLPVMPIISLFILLAAKIGRSHHSNI